MTKHSQNSLYRIDHTRVEFKSFLRIRPLLKKEREDPIVLEAIDATSVALHPPPFSIAMSSNNNNNNIADTRSPHSSLSQDATVLTAQDEEFHLDRVFSGDASQDKVYLSVGQHTALEAMEALKMGDLQQQQQRRRNKAHLVLGIGLAASGKTYTVAGNPSYLSKRKHESDGLVPRIIDSFFSQAKHNLVYNKKKYSFVVQMSIIQVNQSKSSLDDCELIDLLQPVIKKRTNPSSKAHATGFGGLASSLINSMDLSLPHQSLAFHKKNHRARNMEDNMDPLINIQQDPNTSECFLVNGTHKACYSSEEARETLQKAISSSRKLVHKKYQSHVLMELQPQLVSNRSGRTAKSGEKIAILDLVGCEESNCKQRTTRRVDSLPDRSYAYNSLMNCLKAMQHNEKISASLSNNALGSISEYSSSTRCIDDSSLDSKCKIVASPASPRKVPFRQHKVTMLLQQLFSLKQAEKTMVTLLLTASPSSQDRADNKVLLNEIVSLHRPPPRTCVATGVVPRKKMNQNHKSSSGGSRPDVQKNSHPVGGHNRSIGGKIETNKNKVDKPSNHPGIDKVPSMTYSDSTFDDESIIDARPPPVAPDFKEAAYLNGDDDSFHGMKAHPLSTQASAPFEETEDISLVTKPPVLQVDLPGMFSVPPGSTKSALTDAFSMDVKTDSNVRMNPTSTETGDTVLPTDSKFSYMKTINKVVHASKKTGRKVMERIAVSSDNHAQLTENKLHERLLELEKLNSELIAENQTLREKNMELKQKLEKQTSDDRDDDPWDEDGSQCSKSICTTEDDLIQEIQKSCLDSTSRQNSDRTDYVSSPTSTFFSKGEDESQLGALNEESVAGEKTYDEPLLELMANLNHCRSDRNVGKESASRGKGLRTKRDDAETVYNETQPKVDSRRSSQGDFENPLLRHMAMMNSMNY